jgi:hypothetical protein
MNFPVGEVISKSHLPITFEKIALELEKIRFNGYIIQTVESSVIEEGVLFFREGEFNSCIVECLAKEKTFKGDDAVPFFLNQTKGKGFFHTIQLTRSQVDLVTAFDEKLLLKNKLPLKNLPKIIPWSFEDKFIENGVDEDVLEKYGLSSLKK